MPASRTVRTARNARTAGAARAASGSTTAAKSSRKRDADSMVDLEPTLALDPTQSDLSDESLITQYHQTGDRGLFETLMKRYEREIISYLRRYCANAEVAEDAFQGTFLQVHLKCGQFDPARRFRPWLYAIATNQAIDVQRRNKRHRMVSLDRSASDDTGDQRGNWSEKLVGDFPDPLLSAAQQENGRWVHRSVDSLGEPMKQVVHLVYYQGMKYREAADVLGIPVGTVKSRLHAAVHRLSHLWQDDHRADPDDDQSGDESR